MTKVGSLCDNEESRKLLGVKRLWCALNCARKQTHCHCCALAISFLRWKGLKPVLNMFLWFLLANHTVQKLLQLGDLYVLETFLQSSLGVTVHLNLLLIMLVLECFHISILKKMTDRWDLLKISSILFKISLHYFFKDVEQGKLCFLLSKLLGCCSPWKISQRCWMYVWGGMWGMAVVWAR